MAYDELCLLDSVPLGACLAKTSRLGTKLVVVRLGETNVRVFLDRCAHQNIPLSQFGDVKEDHLVCKAHGAVFDLETGELRSARFECAGLTMVSSRITGGYVCIHESKQ